MAVEIREASELDVDAILRIRMLANKNKLQFDLTRDMLVKAIRRHCKAFLLINDLGECVGFSMADKAGKLIWGLFVWEPYQGKGYGKLLLKVACEWLFKQRSGWALRKIRDIELTTEAESEAILFYQSLGWEPRGLTEQGYQRLGLSYDKYQQLSW